MATTKRQLQATKRRRQLSTNSEPTSKRSRTERSNNMAAPLKPHPVTAEQLLKVADNLGERDCIPLAVNLGFDLPYINMLNSSALNYSTPRSILFSWQAAESSAATNNKLCDALVRSGRSDLAEATFYQHKDVQTLPIQTPSHIRRIADHTRQGDPTDALADLASAACLHYRSLQVKPLPWLRSVKAIQAKALSLNLAIVQETVVENMLSSFASSSAKEIERQEYIFSKAIEHKLVKIHSLFPQFQSEQTLQKNMVLSESSDAAAALHTTHAEAPVGQVCKFSPVATSGEEDTMSPVLHSTKRVGMYGAAGCGKTSCLIKAASMYAEKQLWPRAHAFLLLELRDPNVQDAENLMELLRQLKLGLSHEKCESLASALRRSDGENVILALDGVDELDTRKTGYVWRLLDGSALPKACVLATSRPSSIARQYFDEYGVNLELLGFSEDQVDQFIKEQLVDEMRASMLHRVLFENPMLASLMLVPLLATMVCQMFHLVEKPPTTRTLLYSKLIADVIKCTVKKHGGCVPLSADEIAGILEASDVLALDKGAKKLVCKLGLLAYQAHEQGQVIFDQAFVKKASCSDEALQLGLLSESRAEKDGNLIRLYFFQHVTVQEFLVAYHLNANIASEKELKHSVNTLIRSRGNDIILQFFAGMLQEKHLRYHFFDLLNEWLHENYDGYNVESRRRLRICLQCAKEGCGGKMEEFPSCLHLPKVVVLENVTAADLTQLSLALGRSEDIDTLTLYFDKVITDTEDKKKVSRVKTQTRQALTRLMVAIHANPSLRRLHLYGPKYDVFEDESWKLLVKTVEKNSLKKDSLKKIYLENLVIAGCEIPHASFRLLSEELRRNEQLTHLWLWDNSLDDRSERTLVDDLKHNQTLRVLSLSKNNFTPKCRKRLQGQLKHIDSLHV